jgi:hypothetical protein
MPIRLRAARRLRANVACKDSGNRGRSLGAVDEFPGNRERRPVVDFKFSENREKGVFFNFRIYGNRNDPTDSRSLIYENLFRVELGDFLVFR